MENFHKEPNIHIVFKDEKKLQKFEDKLFKTSKISGFLLDEKKFQNRNSFIEGDWWVQDFSSFLPLYNFEEINKNKLFLRCLCSTRGKVFSNFIKEIKCCIE